MHVEYHRITGLAPLAGGFAQSVITLDKSGAWIGGSATLGVRTNTDDLIAGFIDALVYGTHLTSATIRLSNFSGGNETNATVHVLLFIRD